jgi:hypothetical protein
MRDKLLFEALKKLFLVHSILDYATVVKAKRILFQSDTSWKGAFAQLYLNDFGELSLMQPEASDSQDPSAFHQASAFDTGASSAAVPRRHGRPRKVKLANDTPLVKSEVRYCTRNNNAGYKIQTMPGTRKTRKASKAILLEVLQIEEMQRIGVEDCQIEPEKLTVERLMQGREK